MSFSEQNSRQLFERCQNNQVKEALSLLDRVTEMRINVNQRFIGGCTCAFFAAFNGSVELMKKLIECGADTSITEDNGVTPFAVACVQGKPGIVECLLSSDSGQRLDQNQIVTGLTAACQYGSPQIVRQLLATGVDINMRIDDEGATLLYAAVETAQEEVVTLLLGNGAKTNLPRSHYYPIQVATQISHYGIMERLLKAKADPNAQTSDGATAMLIAAQNGNIRAVDLLAKYKASPNIQMTTDGSSCLYVACARHHYNTAIALMEVPGIDVDLAMKDGSTVLHVLSQYGNVKLITELFKRFPSIKFDTKRKDGLTPLLTAARHGQHEICQLLYEHGADIHVQVDGETPLDVATRYGRSDTIRVLKEALEKERSKQQQQQ
ncbi:hypothetical protein SAMD00019534_120720 [Acytostelium subglobosum LB1]|uniref:hypothetical protein n=1 Tax=Acytostelium subglobosum LB1 TaxID=1410327 RepID=UPI000644DF11|nr:hypothetical protein SAMD00019534_120720 [Acytostelium subglobosum LB1]GAM28896.1 hypothetical protein SAMD00019534_120720 [Acytostelium subglobosum LB1]|eukprot:XP_012748081.1 hypothetical protein SAMD00019534_120720 [Acytostelium subglobosum LB1]